MIDIEQALRNRYPNLHPLLFSRCLEKATSDVHLFDLLETMPTEYPIVWDDVVKSWCHTEDLLQSS